MTTPTTRYSHPVATPRAGAGRGSRAVHDPGLDRLLADPRLSSTAKAIAVVLTRRWAWKLKTSCWPSDKSIAAAVGRSVGQVQRGLRQLEQTGWIAREKTDEVPNGRQLHLLWRGPWPGAGAQPGPSEARSGEAAPARSKESRNREPAIELEKGADSRPRPQTTSDPAPLPEAPAPLPEAPAPLPEVPAPLPEVPAPLPEAPAPLPEAPAPPRPPRPAPEAPGPSRASPEGPFAVPIGQALRGLAQGLPGPPAAPAVASEVRPPARGVPPPGVPPRPAAPPPAPDCSPPSPRRIGTRRRGLGLSLAELAAVASASGDPILARELAKRTAPPPPPEPPPQALPTGELFGKLPGRHDLIAAATQRLCADLGDFKPASWSFFRKAVEAVVRRSVAVAVLLSCHRQATGPKAECPGKVFVTCWKREAHLRC